MLDLIRTKREHSSFFSVCHRCCMTANDILNERIKLGANWCNTLATAIITVGSLAPAAQFAFGSFASGIDSSVIYGSGGICVGAGIFLHLLGQWFLGLLR